MLPHVYSSIICYCQEVDSIQQLNVELIIYKQLNEPSQYSRSIEWNITRIQPYEVRKLCHMLPRDET